VELSGWTFISAEKHRYSFQDQEKDKEFWGGAASYKYRVEDPRLGKFFSVDPLAPEYAYNSHYAFSENRVVDSVELEGLERVDANNEVVGNVYFSFDSSITPAEREAYVANYETSVKSVWQDQEGYQFNNVTFTYYNGAPLGPDDLWYTVGPLGGTSDYPNPSGVSNVTFANNTGYMVFNPSYGVPGNGVFEAAHEYGHSFGLADRYYNALYYENFVGSDLYTSSSRFATMPMDESLFPLWDGYNADNNLYSSSGSVITPIQRLVFEDKAIVESFPQPAILIGRPRDSRGSLTRTIYNFGERTFSYNPGANTMTGHFASGKLSQGHTFMRRDGSNFSGNTRYVSILNDRRGWTTPLRQSILNLRSSIKTWSK
jgi:hypothetical protein